MSGLCLLSTKFTPQKMWMCYFGNVIKCHAYGIRDYVITILCGIVLMGNDGYHLLYVLYMWDHDHYGLINEVHLALEMVTI